MDLGIIFGILIGRPFLALVPALFFAVWYFRSRRPAVLVAALAWLACFSHEQAMTRRMRCSGECNIRVDLLLLYPLLVLVSVLAAAAHARTRRAAERA